MFRASQVLQFFLLIFLLGGCAYKFGRGPRAIPGGYRQISIPMFKNKSQETGLEVPFTSAMIQEFLRSKVAKVVEEPMAEVRIEGEIVSVTATADAKQEADKSNLLPQGTVLALQYRLITNVNLRAVRRSDGEVLWQGSFRGEGTYSAPQVTLSGVNTVNPLYNLSARRQNLESIAKDMMVEAHSRMTENF